MGDFAATCREGGVAAGRGRWSPPSLLSPQLEEVTERLKTVNEQLGKGNTQVRELGAEPGRGRGGGLNMILKRRSNKS